MIAPELQFILHLLRVDRGIADFNSSPDVRAFYASTELPPMVKPYPCPSK